MNLGRGVSISAVTGENGRISFINFTHPTKDGRSCTKGLPIRKRGRATWKFRDGAWSLYVERDRTITLSPSLWCVKHNVHGLLSRGRWESYSSWDRFLEQSPETMERQIEEAIKDAEAYGGGFWGAILAIASRKSL